MEYTSAPIAEKIRAIRDVQEMGRQAFCDATGVPKQTLINVENGRNEPSFKVMRKVTQAFPQYTMWLMNDQVIEEAGQISPEIEQARKTLKQTGTDTD
ncbi:helix-turn-helix domain-containing protein [Halomonas maura]|uniref:helix-turn-helix domain-containing protein n=1 Tax=Halomonas maura TaxID=117606 RepID=UPI0025B35BCD|nr:helix-turn-helix transcriptional regulator [Halomonas maura]MDN3554478.1 helix-turn-helix transcriptional regulator [Halomonas maura]